MSFVEGSIGSGDGELALVRTRIGSGQGSAHISTGPHQWDSLYLQKAPIFGGGTRITVFKDARFEQFDAPGTLPTGSTLSVAGSDHHYRTADGTLIVFSDPSGSFGSTSNYCNGNSAQTSCVQLPSSITSPDGKKVDLSWDIWMSCTDIIDPENDPCSYWTRIASVSNSFGYRIAFAMPRTAAAAPPTRRRPTRGSGAPAQPSTMTRRAVRCRGS